MQRINPRGAARARNGLRSGVENRLLCGVQRRFRVRSPGYFWNVRALALPVLRPLELSPRRGRCWFPPVTISSSTSALSFPPPPLLPPPYHQPPHYQAMCWLHPFPFSSNRATGAGGLEITCAVLCFRPDTVINHCPSHTSTYNNKDWLLCGGCRPIAFHCADAKLEVNGHSQTLLPCPQTVSSFRYLSISGLSAELLPALPGGPRLLGGGSELLLGLFGFDSAPIS